LTDGLTQLNIGKISCINPASIDTVRHLAIANRILIQAEAEAKEYIEGLLKAAGRSDIKVTFGDEATDKEVIQFNVGQREKYRIPPFRYTSAQQEVISFGFVPSLAYR
jgi:hypothetical protein